MTMTNPAYTVRLMTLDEVELAVDWAAREGWNPGLDDARIFHATDPDGFFVGVLDGEPIASISLVAYDEHFAFLGLYIVKQEFRGRGYGLALWREAVARRARPLIGLDGVVAQQTKYEKSGFRPAYRNIRFGGTAPSATDDAELPCEIVPAHDVPFERLVAYDREFFPAARAKFLQLWLEPEQRRFLGIPIGSARSVALVARDGERILGLGAIRACRSGFKIGPLYAEDERTADVLFLQLAAYADGANVYLDVPEPNEAALRLAKRYGMEPVFESARMYTGPAPNVALARLFGVATFELG
jgi:ribosomal protein S18 acetylase RimI-like enzyme